MNKTEAELLKNAIQKYKLKQYSEADFHGTVQMVIGLLTESQSSHFRQKLETVEGELEAIDFLNSHPRQDYLQRIEEVEKLIESELDSDTGQ